jgi:putative membrane protein
MKRALILLLMLSLAACGRDNDDDDAADTAPAKTDSAVNAARPPVFPEDQAIGVLHALSDAEIAMARSAREMSQNEAVLAYANVLAADYQGIKDLFTQPAAENQLSASIRTAGDSIARQLMLMSGGFNNTFIEEQIKAHQQTLAVLDTALIPSARDTAVRSLLQQIRPTIAAHLQRGMQILAQRRQDAQARGEQWVSGFQPRRDSAVFAPSIITEPAGPMTAPPPRADTVRPQPRPMPLPRPETIMPPPISTSND